MTIDKWLAEKKLRYNNSGQLLFGNERVEELAQKFGTPLYIINADSIRTKYQNLFNALSSRYDKIRIHYAVKANSNLAVLRLLNQLGAHVDTVSPGEIILCEKAGFTADKILQTSNNWTRDEIQFAYDHQVALNLDSLSDIEKLKSILRENIPLPLVSFRINPEIGGGHHDHCITAGANVKFGIYEENAVKAYQQALDLGITRFGIHMHIGSGILNLETFELAMTKLFEILKRIRETLQIEFEFIDFGGGLGIPYRKTESSLNIEEYAQRIGKMFQENCEQLNLGNPVLCIEPGRYLVSESSVIAAQINTIKQSRENVFIGLDAGFNTLVRPMLYGSYHEIIPCNQGDDHFYSNVRFVGQICESGDVLGTFAQFPEISENDYVAILDTGAYGFSMASTYNSRPRPAEIMISDEFNPTIVRNRETMADLMKNQVNYESLFPQEDL